MHDCTSKCKTYPRVRTITLHESTIILVYKTSDYRLHRCRRHFVIIFDKLKARFQIFFQLYTLTAYGLRRTQFSAPRCYFFAPSIFLLEKLKIFDNKSYLLFPFLTHGQLGMKKMLTLKF